MITFLRGTSGSGKSTYAKEHEDADPKHTVVISRDRLRKELLGEEKLARYFAQGMEISFEDAISSIERERFRNAALDDMNIYDGKLDIIVDNLNIKKQYIDEYMRTLATIGYPYGRVSLKEFDVPVEECAKRCAKRDEAPIPMFVIQAQRAYLDTKPKWALGQYTDDFTNNDWADWLKEDKEVYRPNFPITPYVPDTTKPKAIICDLDGTLAHRVVLDDGKTIHLRGWYNDEEDVETDSFDEQVLNVIQAMADKGYALLFVSGRKEQAREPSERWLKSRLSHPFKLFMRDPIKDMHDSYHDGDDKVKYRIFNEEIRDNYDVQAVFDDRKRVIAMWEALGLKVFNVGKLNDDF